jgi:hypothetical protein
MWKCVCSFALPSCLLENPLDTTSRFDALSDLAGGPNVYRCRLDESGTFRSACCRVCCSVGSWVSVESGSFCDGERAEFGCCSRSRPVRLVERGDDEYGRIQ